MENCIANWPIIADYLRIFISWPFIAGGLILAFWLFNKAEIKERLKHGVWKTPIGDSYPPQQEMQGDKKTLAEMEKKLDALEKERDQLKAHGATVVDKLEETKKDILTTFDQAIEIAFYYRFKHLSLYLVPNAQRVLVAISQEPGPTGIGYYHLTLWGIFLKPQEVPAIIEALLLTELIEETKDNMTGHKVYSITGLGKDFLAFLKKENILPPGPGMFPDDKSVQFLTKIFNKKSE